MSLDVLDAPDIITVPVDAAELEPACEAKECDKVAAWICRWEPCPCGRNTFLFCDEHKNVVISQNGLVVWFCPTSTHQPLMLLDIRSIR